MLVVAHLIGVATSLHALMTVRTAQGAIAWVVSLNTIPLIAVPAYWVFGRSKFEGYVIQRRSRGLLVDAAAPCFALACERDSVGAMSFVYYELDLEQLAKLDWTFLNGGHGNVGSKDDISFYRTFLTDLKQAVGKALGEVPWGTGVDASKVNAHTAFLPAWLEAVSKKAVDTLRSKYGRYYGFEHAMPRNAEMVAMSMFAYR